MTSASVFDTVRGLPLHALVVHATVVVVPLVAIAVAAVAAMPSWRRRFSRYALVAAVLVVPLVGVTILSGRQLRDRLPANEAITRHASLGNTLFWWVLALAAAMAVLALVPLPSGRRKSVAGTNVVAGIVVLLALISLVQVARTGEAGSSAVWKTIVESTTPG